MNEFHLIKEGVDSIGQRCNIHPSVKVVNWGMLGKIMLEDDVSIFADVRLVVGGCKDFSASNKSGLFIGKGTVINVGSYLSGEGLLEIGEKVLIGPHVNLLSAGHEIHSGSEIIMENKIEAGRISISDGAWIGAGAIVLQDVKIGKGAVVGAGTVVVKDVPDYAVVVGNPGRVVHYREGCDDGKKWFVKALEYFKRNV